VAVPDQRCTAPLCSRCTASGTHDTDGHSSFLSHRLQQHTLPRSRGALLRERAFAAAALAGPIPVFSCFSPDSDSSIPGLTISSTHTSSFPRRIFAPGVLHPCFTHPESRGGRSADRRSGAAAPVGRIMTRYARRLARRLASHDAGRSPLGAPPRRFWASGPRFSHRHPPLLTLRRASDRAQRAPRSQVVVPGGRGPGPPGASGYEPPPQDATPRSAFRIVSGDAPR
jgi:hypothetical protein